jgi:hypothetical protein
MKTISVWTICTCDPPVGTPQVFVYPTEAAALAAFDTMMRSEWEANAPTDEETDEPLPYPGDPQEAHDAIDEDRDDIEENDGLSEVWGRYRLEQHDLQLED